MTEKQRASLRDFALLVAIVGSAGGWIYAAGWQGAQVTQNTERSKNNAEQLGHMSDTLSRVDENVKRLLEER